MAGGKSSRLTCPQSKSGRSNVSRETSRPGGRPKRLVRCNPFGGCFRFGTRGQNCPCSAGFSQNSAGEGGGPAEAKSVRTKAYREKVFLPKNTVGLLSEPDICDPTGPIQTNSSCRRLANSRDSCPTCETGLHPVERGAKQFPPPFCPAPRCGLQPITLVCQKDLAKCLR